MRVFGDMHLLLATAKQLYLGWRMKIQPACAYACVSVGAIFFRFCSLFGLLQLLLASRLPVARRCGLGRTNTQARSARLATLAGAWAASSGTF